MFLIDALARQDRITPVCMLHEQACAIASVGHNIYTNTLSSVVCVTTGPGGTNAITGVTAAWIDSTPLLVISGQVPLHMMMDSYEERQSGPQEVDITSIVEPITYDATILLDAEHVQRKMELIFDKEIDNTCWPIWLDVPLDVQSARI